MTNRYSSIITEIEEQTTALQQIIDAKKAELEALTIEIPELEAQLISMNELFSNVQQMQRTSTSSNAIVYNSPTHV